MFMKLRYWQKKQGMNNIYAAAVLLILTSCSAPKALTSSAKPDEITDLKAFDAVTYIELIEESNRSNYNDSLSLASQRLFMNVLGSFEGRLPLSGTLSITDQDVQNAYDIEITNMIRQIEHQKSLNNLIVSPVVDSILEARQQRYGLITVATGYTRASGNYSKQIAKGLGLAVLTLGMFYTVPVKASSDVYMLIVDSRYNEVVFYKKSILTDREPLDETVLKNQIQSIFSGYFWP